MFDVDPFRFAGVPSAVSRARTARADAVGTPMAKRLSESHSDLPSALTLLGFSDQGGGLWVSNTAYRICVLLNAVAPDKSRVDYGSEITVSHKGSAKLSKPESLVVLECVLRLLRQGYPPNCLELEKTWKLGHEGKGRLDILVRNGSRRAFALIECKTWGVEYAEERDKILEDGGQLFSYFIQEKSAKVLALYASDVRNGVVRHNSECVLTKSLTGSSLDELFASWDKSFSPDLLFHPSAAPYSITRPPLRKRDLLDLDRQSGKGLFNSFAEALRRNVVSDKPNAFNKIFNLFVCKIFDEDTKAASDVLDFQWKAEDDDTTVLDRLIELYRRGLSQYLGIDVDPDHFSGMSEFAFVDVFNDESYARNAAILREVLELLQIYRIKYSGKHQFLGEFFEHLLATGIKQEAGQFFTPTPLARFILRSLPLEDVISRKIEWKDRYILPYIIDFACGSGHFLTECIDELTPLMATVDESKLTGQAKAAFVSMRDNYLWAKEYVYGIDRDYRLAKTTKIAMFLNGDGEATVVNGDGLDDFHTSATYAGKLKTMRAASDNRVFDVVVANPPFSISGFKRYVPHGAENFRLFRFLSPKSTEIECLFLERLGQLLKGKGVAGIILPLSILNSNRAIYTEARKQLLVNFCVRGLVELRERTFIATPTTTVAVFLERRADAKIAEAVVAVRSHLLDHTAGPGCEAAIETAAERLGAEIDKTELADEIRSLFPGSGTPRGVDTTRLSARLCMTLICYLTAEEETVTAFSGEKKVLERFLGYRFSKGRSSEGIHLLRHKGKVQSYLYDEDDRENAERVSTHIRACFRGDEIDVPKALKNHVTRAPTAGLVSGKTFVVRNPSDAFVTSANDVRSISPIGDIIDLVDLVPVEFSKLVRDGDVAVVEGLVYKKEAEVPTPTKNRILTASNIDRKTATLIFEKYRYLREDYVVPQVMFPRPGDIIMSKASGSLPQLGKCCQSQERVSAAIGGFLMILRCANEHLAKAILYRLLSAEFRRFVAGLKDQNINNLGEKDLNKFRWMLPKNLKAFADQAKRKEEELMRLREQVAKMGST